MELLSSQLLIRLIYDIHANNSTCKGRWERPEGREPNSPANPLPTAVCVGEIPLPEVAPPTV